MPNQKMINYRMPRGGQGPGDPGDPGIPGPRDLCCVWPAKCQLAEIFHWATSPTNGNKLVSPALFRRPRAHIKNVKYAYPQPGGEMPCPNGNVYYIRQNQRRGQKLNAAPKALR